MDIKPNEKFVVLPHQTEVIGELENLVGYWPTRDILAAPPGSVLAEQISNTRTALLRAELGHILVTIVEW